MELIRTGGPLTKVPFFEADAVQRGVAQDRRPHQHVRAPPQGSHLPAGGAVICKGRLLRGWCELVGHAAAGGVPEQRELERLRALRPLFLLQGPLPGQCRLLDAGDC